MSKRCYLPLAAAAVVFFAVSVATAAPAVTSKAPNQPKVSLVGHAHMDFAFLWPWRETQTVVKNTFSTLSGLMDEYPFVFSQSQAALYEETKRTNPELYAKIQDLAKRGQWDVSTAGMWSECDTNIPSGESLVRSIMLAKRFIKEEFGVEPTVGWEPDTFGHSLAMPQILAKSGMKYYYFMRGQGQPLFWWKSPDGSKVLAYNFGKYNQGIKDDELASAASRFAARTGVNDYMHVYGVGDHGGGPTRGQLKKITDLQSRPGYPELKYSTAAGYFDRVATSGGAFPTITTELNPVFPGCYTSHSDMKRYNRECENSLVTSEVLASVASVYGAVYPGADFDALWRKTCFNQFHDIICGTAIHAAYDYAKQLHDEVMTQTSQTSQTSASAVASKINTRGAGIPIVVYNPLGWTRTDFVSVASPFADEATAVKITDQSGRVCAGRTLGNRLTFTARNVPAMGYEVFWVRRVSKPIGSNVSANGSVVENQYFRVKIDPETGVISGIYDKINQRNVVAPGQTTDLLQILSEQSSDMSAWRIGKITGKQTLLDKSEIIRVDMGPAKATLQYDHRYGNSIFTQELTLYDGVPRIDIRLAADWKEPFVADKTTPMLKVAFLSNLTNPKATFEIPFGSIQRPTDGKECVGQKWADLSDLDYGVSILNDCKYGFDASGNMLRISLLRSPRRPDVRADIGMHEMTFSIYPHTGDWRSAGTVRKGYELNQPLMGFVTSAHDGSLPAERSYLSVSAPNLAVTALKNAEDGDGVIVRLYETNGQPCQSVVHTSLPCSSYVETDLMERPIGKPEPITNGRFLIHVGKYSIQTYKLLKQ